MTGPPTKPPPSGSSCPSCGANLPVPSVWLSLAGWAMPWPRSPEIVPVAQASLELILKYGWDPAKGGVPDPPR